MKHSENIGEITRALVKAQSEMKAAKMSGDNPFYESKYATLADVWDAVKEPLQNNELAVTQGLSSEDGRIGVTTILSHTSGEYFESVISMTPQKNTPQGAGSTITYLRRYSLSAMIGAVNDEDDDGNEASAPAGPKKKPIAKTKKAEPKITEAEALRELHAKCLTGINILYKKDSKEWKDEMGWLEGYKKEGSISEMTKLHGILVAQYKAKQKKDTEAAGAEGFDGKVKDALIKGTELQPGDMF